MSNATYLWRRAVQKNDAIALYCMQPNQKGVDNLTKFFLLSIAVSAVVQQQQALEITSVVDAIFAQQMPPSVRDKARDRVSNILFEGARKNK